MNPDDFPAPKDGFVIAHFLVVSDQDRSREFYRSLFDGQVLLERDPVIMKVANTWLILNVGGGPTDDKPTVTLTTPPDPSRTSAFLNVRVADIHKVHKEWSAKGAEFLTEPKDHGREIRAYIRDPDGHLIEVGQATGILSRTRQTGQPEYARNLPLAAGPPPGTANSGRCWVRLRGGPDVDSAGCPGCWPHPGGPGLASALPSRASHRARPGRAAGASAAGASAAGRRATSPRGLRRPSRSGSPWRTSSAS